MSGVSNGGEVPTTPTSLRGQLFIGHHWAIRFIWFVVGFVLGGEFL